MTTHQPEMDDALDEYWALHLKAQDAANEASGRMEKAVADMKTEQADAARLRREAAALIAQAEGHEARAASADTEARKRHDEHNAAKALAAVHFSTVERLMSGTNLGHPRTRFRQAAESFDKAPLEAPLPPPLVGNGHAVGNTQGFPAQQEPVS